MQDIVGLSCCGLVQLGPLDWGPHDLECLCGHQLHSYILWTTRYWEGGDREKRRNAEKRQLMYVHVGGAYIAKVNYILTGCVVADICEEAGAGLVVGEHAGEIRVATHAEELAGGLCGVAGLLCPIIPLYESHVVLHQGHLLPHHRAVPGSGLLHPDVLWGTWVCQRHRTTT